MVNGIFRIAPRWEKLAGQTWSTRPFCRPLCAPAKLLKDSNRSIFRVGTAFALIDPNRFGLGELHAVRLWSRRRLGERRSDRSKRGAPPMENTLLVGLSRQMILDRQLDVVANNIANVNTNGYKADHMLFEQYLTSGAHEDNFKGSDRRVSYVQDRGTFHDMAAGALEQTGNPLDVAISGNGFLTVQAPGGERYTRDGNLQLNATGQLVTANGDPVLGNSGPIVFQPTDHDIVISADGTI